VHPSPLSDVYIGPNGVTLLTEGINLWDILAGMEDEDVDEKKVVNVIEIAEGSEIPDGLVLLNEKADNYSLQCSRPMTIEELEKHINKFFENFPIYDKSEYFNKYPL
jgi:hypothetical protein